MERRDGRERRKGGKGRKKWTERINGRDGRDGGKERKEGNEGRTGEGDPIVCVYALCLQVNA